MNTEAASGMACVKSPEVAVLSTQQTRGRTSICPHVGSPALSLCTALISLPCTSDHDVRRPTSLTVPVESDGPCWVTAATRCLDKPRSIQWCSGYAVDTKGVYVLLRPQAYVGRRKVDPSDIPHRTATLHTWRFTLGHLMVHSRDVGRAA
jgi:hypothetical protein